MILSGRKGATAPFSCLPARTGSGRARNWVKGLALCGFSGQRPELSESFLIPISAIFKVLLGLIFLAQFFIDYLTLPYFIYVLFCFWNHHTIFIIEKGLLQSDLFYLLISLIITEGFQAKVIKYNLHFINVILLRFNTILYHSVKITAGGKCIPSPGK